MDNKNWTKEQVLSFVEENGGVGFLLMGEYPYTKLNEKAIQKAMNDDTMADSELSDYCIQLALRQCKA